MQLETYLSQSGMSAAAFALLVGVTPSTISRYCAGHRRPTRTVMARIVAATAGEVQPNDFFDLPASAA